MATFSDNFNRADSTDLGGGWVEVSGDWAIVSGSLSPGADSGTIILRAAAEVATSDHYAQVTISGTAAASQGVWCRGNANISNGYLWRSDGSSWDLFSIVSSTFTILGTYTAPLAPGDVAKVQAVGSTVKAFVNGVERVSAVNTAVPSGTFVGLRSDSVSSIRYDAFIAADVLAGTALGVAAAIEAAQSLVGGKTAPLGVTTAVEAGQSLAGGKSGALTPAVEAVAVQALTGDKAALLPSVGTTEAAQPLTGAVSRTLNLAAGVDTSRPLTGAKTYPLGTAVETATARALTSGSPGLDLDIDLTVGLPHGASYPVGPPQSSGWKVGAPC
ncbi:hypothetical protein [Streptomyces sp. BH104]|uniref:hypothetical protein n=1 Tax=Streptomyces sp. BH104 TaxID=3410407 RepID=UPI003BB6C123